MNERIEKYERVWMWLAMALVVMFLTAIGLGAWLSAIHPPSHVETVDPTTLPSHPEFGNPVTTTRADLSVVVPVVASMFQFTPTRVEVPANKPVTFRLTSSDVMHGFEIVGTDTNAMAIPGYVSQFTVTFATPGEYVITCNEYCGLLHHNMVGTLIVK